MRIQPGCWAGLAIDFVMQCDVGGDYIFPALQLKSVHQRLRLGFKYGESQEEILSVTENEILEKKVIKVTVVFLDDDIGRDTAGRITIEDSAIEASLGTEYMIVGSMRRQFSVEEEPSPCEIIQFFPKCDEPYYISLGSDIVIDISEDPPCDIDKHEQWFQYWPEQSTYKILDRTNNNKSINYKLTLCQIRFLENTVLQRHRGSGCWQNKISFLESMRMLEPWIIRHEEVPTTAPSRIEEYLEKGLCMVMDHYTDRIQDHRILTDALELKLSASVKMKGQEPVETMHKEEEMHINSSEVEITGEQLTQTIKRLPYYWVEFVERIIGTMFTFQLHEFVGPDYEVIMAFSIENHRLPSYLTLSHSEHIVPTELILMNDSKSNETNRIRQNYSYLLILLKSMRNAIRVSPNSIKHDTFVISINEYLGGLRLLIQLIRTVAVYTNRQQEVMLPDPLKVTQLKISSTIIVDLYNERDRKKIRLLSRYLSLKSAELAMMNGVMPPVQSDALFICIWLLLRHPLKPATPP